MPCLGIRNISPLDIRHSKNIDLFLPPFLPQYYLITGGSGKNGLPSYDGLPSEIFSLSTNQWSPAAPLDFIAPLTKSACGSPDSTTVLCAGGRDDEYENYGDVSFQRINLTWILVVFGLIGSSKEKYIFFKMKLLYHLYFL